VASILSVCKRRTANFASANRLEHPVVDPGEVIDYYNKATSSLPDHNELKGLKLPGESIVLDIKGERFAEMFEANQRRLWISLAEVPDHVRNAFIAAEGQALIPAQGH
jgi:penicillin-binding protein 1A